MTSTEQEHTDLVKRLIKPGYQIISDLDPIAAHLLHMAIGICGEAGELLDAIKKRAIYKQELDYHNVTEELGDLEFYMRGLRDMLNITREETLLVNISKLTIRYGTTYSNESAQARADKQ